MFNLSGKLHWQRMYLMAIGLMLCISGLTAMVVPHPLYKYPPKLKASHPSELFGPRAATKDRPLPQNILVLRVQFSDVRFQSVPAYPDSVSNPTLIHDRAYFERWMMHLRDFYGDASRHRQPYPYVLNYTIPDVVFTLPNAMSYYGGDTSEESDARVPDMILELIQMADPSIDFNQYDAFIVFHAGPGQESDIDSSNSGEIWSTFLSRSDFQYAFDPDNDNYQGIQTNDGRMIKEIVLIPESEYQDYFIDSGYLFSIFGVLCHQFGHQIGLPTLFDNVSSNGKSQGIGNWGLMGTGVWNANGYVPAQLEAWSRYYLGWETAQTIDYDAQNVRLDYFLNNDPDAHRLYKIPISDKEYFLIENRQQNPDNSIETWTYYLDPPDTTYTYQETVPSFSFVLTSSGQDYYPYPNSDIPYFNFMENAYKGCEWDFYLPGLGGPVKPPDSAVKDGSGMLIWHIDENVLDENFDPGFDYNHINGDASHKAVDLEEADGIQQLDTAAFDYYKYGGPYDAFRADAGNPDANNTYFGNETYNGLLHLPTAESYYGGIPIEIYDISASGLVMNFSVRVGWKLETLYSGINNLDACSIDYDHDGENEIFYPMPNGEISIWKDEVQLADTPQYTWGDIKSYTWDGQRIYMALQRRQVTFPVASLNTLNNQNPLDRNFPHRKWAAPLVVFDDNIALPLITDNGISQVYIADVNTLTLNYDLYHAIQDSICSNLVYFKQKLFCLSKGTDGYRLSKFIPLNYDSGESYLLAIPRDSIIVAMTGANITPGGGGDLVIQTPYSVYLTDVNGNIRSGYPKSLSFYCNSPVSISDVDRNGIFDILIGGENTFVVLDYSGESIISDLSSLAYADSLGITAGIIAGDYDGDGKNELMGAFSRNRLFVWDDNQRAMNGYPVSFSNRSRNLPFVHTASDGLVYAWIPSDNGKIYRAKLPETAISGIDENWFCKYANLQRTASREDTAPTNIYQTQSLFVPDEVYVYPNPLKSIYEPKLSFQIMTSRDAKVEVTIHDISGKLLFQKDIQCRAWLKNREQVDFKVDHLSSGVYIAVIKSGNNIKRIKFAVEK